MAELGGLVVQRSGERLFLNAKLRSDGSLHLALDAPLVAARAWTLRPAEAS